MVEEKKNLILPLEIDNKRTIIEKNIYFMNKKMAYKNKFNNSNIKENFNKKERNTGIDLIRMIAMYAIVIDHLIIHGKLIKKYKNYKELYLLLIFCFWHINSFAMISGIIGYKTYKYSNLIYLWICVFFLFIDIFYFC